VKTIVLAGALAQKPGRGGHSWVFLQYLLGFRKLGWDVLFLDSLEAGACVDAQGAASSVERSWNAAYAAAVMEQFGLADRYAILHDRGRRSIGLSRAEVLARIRRSSGLVNVMGFLEDEELLAAAPRRVFLDIDPGFGQMWQALGLHDPFQGHDAHVTIGGNVGTPECGVPTCGRTWITTRQPIVLDHWPVSVTTSDAPFTTVASWRGAYGPIDFDGRRYGLRAHEFRRFAPLPTLTGRPFTIALDIHDADAADKQQLEANGWTTVDPVKAAGDPSRYQDFIHGSRAEVMVAKNMYVASRSGWFSDRSICYLASGKPVLAQDTGIAGSLPTGAGLLTFCDIESAIEGVHAIEGDYARHARAARAVAEELFDSSKVLKALIEKTL
jgi:hypothetical protein